MLPLFFEYSIYKQTYFIQGGPTPTIVINGVK